MAEKYSTRNSTTKPLINGNVFWGQAELASSWSKFKVVVAASHSGSLVIQQSQDAVSWDYEKTHAIPAYVEGSGNYEKILGRIELPYFRVYFENTSGDDQTFLRISTMLYQSGHLEAITDNVRIQGTLEGSVDTPATIEVTTGGRMKVDAAVTIDDMAPADDGIACYGSTDGSQSNTKLLKTDTDGVLFTSDTTTQATLTAIDTGLDKLELNANKNNITELAVATPTDYAIDADITTAIDLGVGEQRMRNACFSGSVGNLGVNSNPKIVMSFSDNNNDFFEDGVYANFYKADGAAEWTFNFQRSNIGQRYIKLKAQNATTINTCRITQSKA